MAYLVELKDACHVSGCSSRAVVELIDRWNASMGKYCRRHSRMELRKQQAREGQSAIRD